MKLLRELLTDVKHLDDPTSDTETDDLDQLLADYEQGEGGVPDEESPEGGDELDLDLDDDVPSDDNMGVEFDSAPSASSGSESPEGDNELDLDLDDEGLDGNEDMDQLAQQATEDPDRAGVIRTVKNSHLVYKRQMEDGTYDELWVYNVKEFDPTFRIKKAILAGTDIPPGKLQSADGKQTYTSWASGNAEMLLIKGLPN